MRSLGNEPCLLKLKRVLMSLGLSSAKVGDSTKHSDIEDALRYAMYAYDIASISMQDSHYSIVDLSKSQRRRV
jgi:hypothetical protein